MYLEARSQGCFSSKFILKRDDRPIGKYEGQWFSESLTIQLTERRHLEFRKVGWLGSQFKLVDPEDDVVLGSCDRSGVFTSSWDVILSEGEGQLARAGWFASAYQLSRGGKIRAQVDRLGLCERGWRVEAREGLLEEDLLLLGLIYHTVLQREARQHHAGGHAAGS